MTEAVIPTPRRIARTPVTQGSDAFSVLGDALNVAGRAAGEFVARRRATDEQVDETDHRIALAEERRQDDALYIEKAQEWVQIEAAARQQAAELRQEAGPFARGHSEAVQKLIGERFRAFDESLAGNERVRQRFRLGIVESATTIDLQEQSWQRQQEFKAQGEALETVATTLSNRLTRVDPAQAGGEFAKAVEQVDAMIDAGAYNDDQAATMKRAARTQLALGLKDGLFEAGQPQMVQELVDKGFFDGLDLDAAKVGDQVKSEQRALDIAAEQAQAEAQASAREQARAIEAKIGLGIVPTQQEFDAARAALVGSGASEAELIEFDGLTVQIGLNRQYSEGRDPEGIAAARAASALQQKVATGTASEAEQVAYAHLTDVADARAKAAGTKRAALAEEGVRGQMAVLADLDRLPPEQRFVAANAAMDGLGYVAGLPPHSRRFALDGREARAARPKDFGTKAEVEAAFREVTGGFAGTLGGAYDDMMDLAWDLYAGANAAEGKDGWSASGFRRSVDIAFGMTRRRDGTFQGGVGSFRGNSVILPAYQNEDEFERSVRGLTFAAAVYADGTAARKGDVLMHYRPEYYRDAADGRPVYRMVDANGRPLLKKGGGIYDFTVAR